MTRQYGAPRTPGAAGPDSKLPPRKNYEKSAAEPPPPQKSQHFGSSWLAKVAKIVKRTFSLRTFFTIYTIYNIYTIYTLYNIYNAARRHGARRARFEIIVTKNYEKSGLERLFVTKLQHFNAVKPQKSKKGSRNVILQLHFSTKKPKNAILAYFGEIHQKRGSDRHVVPSKSALFTQKGFGRRGRSISALSDASAKFVKVVKANFSIRNAIFYKKRAVTHTERRLKGRKNRFSMRIFYITTLTTLTTLRHVNFSKLFDISVRQKCCSKLLQYDVAGLCCSKKPN